MPIAYLTSMSDLQKYKNKRMANVIAQRQAGFAHSPLVACCYAKCFHIRSLVASLIPNPINNAPSPRSIQRDTCVLLLR